MTDLTNPNLSAPSGSDLGEGVWYCNTCRAEVHPETVTNDERHELCGTRLSTPSSTVTPDAGNRRYLADRFEFAAPGDDQSDVWLLRFADPDCREAVFTGEDAEERAWVAWNQYAPSYNCWVFRLARLREPATPAIRDRAFEEAADTREILAGAIVAWNEFYPSLKPQDRAEECEFGPMLRLRYLLGRLLDPPLDSATAIEAEAERIIRTLKGTSTGDKS